MEVATHFRRVEATGSGARGLQVRGAPDPESRPDRLRSTATLWPSSGRRRALGAALGAVVTMFTVEVAGSVGVADFQWLATTSVAQPATTRSVTTTCPTSSRSSRGEI